MKRLSVVLILGMSCMLCKAQSNALPERKWSTQMGKAMAWVTQNLDNGAYKGQVSGGNRSGLGVYQWSDGTWCWGRWSNGDMNGKAIYIVPDGYEVVNCPGCVYYVGDHRSGGKSGTGTCYDKNGKLIYHGSFSDDRPTDVYPSSGYRGYKFECIEYSGGDVYIGETDNGVRHGYGIYIWSDGRAWYGPLENGKRAGYGLFLPYKGNCQTGQWRGDTYTEVEQACTYCRGTGQNLCPVCSGRGGYMLYSVWMTCQSCMGRGKQMCMVCKGNGKRITGSTADRVFTKRDSPYAPAVTSYDGESPSSGSGGEESVEEIWNRAVAYDEAGEYAKAVPLYRQLAGQGVVSAQYNLGLCYYNGEGVEKSYTEAVKWLRKAAEQGHASAQRNLGLCYYNGRGVEKSYTEAVKWYRKAAEQGHAAAMYSLGGAYQFGHGVEENGNKALYWYKKGLKSGNLSNIKQSFAKAVIKRLEEEGYSADRAGIR